MFSKNHTIICWYNRATFFFQVSEMGPIELVSCIGIISHACRDFLKRGDDKGNFIPKSSYDLEVIRPNSLLLGQALLGIT